MSIRFSFRNTKQTVRGCSVNKNIEVDDLAIDFIVPMKKGWHSGLFFTKSNIRLLQNFVVNFVNRQECLVITPQRPLFVGTRIFSNGSFSITFCTPNAKLEAVTDPLGDLAIQNGNKVRINAFLGEKGAELLINNKGDLTEKEFESRSKIILVWGSYNSAKWRGSVFEELPLTNGKKPEMIDGFDLTRKFFEQKEKEND